MVLYVMSDQIIEYEKRYDNYKQWEDAIRTGEDCVMDFHEVSQEITGPIYIYY